MNFAKEEKEIKGLCEKGWQHFTVGDFEAAWRVFEKVLLLDSDVAMANGMGAACLYYLGQLDEAETLARKGVALLPQASLHHLFLAQILTAKEGFDEAEAELWEAIALEPANAEFRFMLGSLLLSRGRSSEAREQIKRSLQLSPDNAEAHFLLGLHSLESNQSHEARAEIEEALRLQPNHSYALTVSGLFALVKGDDLLTTPPKLAEYQKAAELFRQAIHINPENELAVENLKLAELLIEQTSKPIEAKPLKSARFDTPIAKLSVAFLSIGFLIVFTYWFGFLLEHNEPLAWLIFPIWYLLVFVGMLIGGWIRGDFSFLPSGLWDFFNRVFKRRIEDVENGELRLIYKADLPKKN
jgi:tetratricopeptide (TPR) repeat protein